MKHSTLPIRNWLVKGLTIVLSLTIISSVYLFLKSATSGKLPTWDKFNYWFLTAAILALVASWLIEGYRIKLIGNSLGERVSYLELIGINFATTFSGNITPFNSGGVPTQIYLLCKNGLAPGKASAIVTIRVITNTLLFSLFAPFLLLFYHARFSFGIMHHLTTLAIPLSIIISIGLILFIIWPKSARNILVCLINKFKLNKFGQKISPHIEKFINEVETFHLSIKEFRNGLNFYLVILCTISYWMTFFAIAPLLMFSFGINVTDLFLEVILFQFILVFILAYVPIPGASGVMELSLYSVLIFIPQHLRAIFILFWRFLSYYVSTFVGGFILLKMINRSTNGPTGSLE